ncbi:MAG: proteasome maturation factor UMP1-domain-containing protein, partial [Olpidium bornovanus]
NAARDSPPARKPCRPSANRSDPSSRFRGHPKSAALRIFPGPSGSAEGELKSVADTAQPEYGVHDALRYGPRSVAAEIGTANKHELEAHLANLEENQFALHAELARKTYGMHAPIRMHMERDLFTGPLRLPGLPSSNLGREILAGRNDTIDFEDFLESGALYVDGNDRRAHRHGPSVGNERVKPRGRAQH